MVILQTFLHRVYKPFCKLIKHTLLLHNEIHVGYSFQALDHETFGGAEIKNKILKIPHINGPFNGQLYMVTYKIDFTDIIKTDYFQRTR